MNWTMNFKLSRGLGIHILTTLDSESVQLPQPYLLDIEREGRF